MLSGTVECPDVCDPQHANTYPRTHKLLLACAKALQCLASVHAYATILGDIAVARKEADTPDKDLAKVQLTKPPHACIVRDLKSDGGRFWGCIAKHDQDVGTYGSGVCIHNDVIKALEGANDPYVVAAASTLVCVTYAHELMHAIHHIVFPQFRLETTPPSIGTDGESGKALEEKLFGGCVEVTWLSHDRVGDFAAIERLTVRSRHHHGLRFLTLKHMNDFLIDINAGEIMPLPVQAMKTTEEAIPPMVSTRGLAIVQAPSPRIASGIAFGPDAVSWRAGADRLPYILPIYHDGRRNWTDSECGAGQDENVGGPH
ncbi:hypothetical protein C8F01DRAFT_13239 [Mycena amicta]|nr:hypothetical protein C8F01DRAFT_13239 [Mycena amicta]